MLVNKKLKFIKPVYFPELTRIGSKNDGGYVIPVNLIDSIDYLICLGVGDDWQFEAQIKNHKKSIYVVAYDGSVGFFHFFLKSLIMIFKFIHFKSNFSIAQNSIKNSLSFFFFFFFKAKFIKRNVVLRSKNTSEINIRDVFKLKIKNVLFKLDIEGGEYKVFSFILRNSPKINMIIVEFHDINKWFSKFTYLMKLAKKNFVIAYVHANNFSNVKNKIPDVIEITLVNKKFYKSSQKLFSSNPDYYRLSMPNNPDLKDIKLMFDDK